MNSQEFYRRFVWQYQKFWLAVVLAFTIFCGWQVAHLPVVTSTDAIIPRDSLWHYYENFREQFGADDGVAVVLHSPSGIFTPETLAYIQKLTSIFEDIEEVESVLSVTNVEDIRGGEEIFEVEPLIGEEIPADTKSLSYLKERARRNPLIFRNLVSEDFKTTLLLLRTNYRGEDLDFENRLVHKVKHILQKNPPPTSVEIHLAGWPVVNVNMAAYMNKDLMVFIPGCFFLLCLLIYVFLHSWRAVLGAAIIINLSLVAAMASLKLVGGALSPMTSVLAPLTMALALADVIHLTMTYFKLSPKERAVSRAVAITWAPCFLTSLTTAIGFGSLMISRVPSIREFGGAAALAMFIEYFLTFTLFAFLLPWIRRGKFKIGFNKTLVEPLAKSYPWWSYKALILFILVAGISISQISKIKVDTNVIDFFHHSTPVYQDVVFVDKHLGGAQTIEISLENPRGDFLDPKLLKKIDEVARWLEKHPLFYQAISPAEFFKLMNRAFHQENDKYFKIPDSRELISQYLLLYGGDELAHFLNEDQNWARISARTPEHSSEKINEAIRELNKKLEEVFKGTGVKFNVTGKTYLVNRTADDIVKSQVESLATAAFLIFGIMFLVLRSLKLGLLSIPSNAFPLVVNFGFMGIMGIPLNTSTATISAVAIGIAVDDTIHFLIRYRRNRKNREPISAVKNTLREKGNAVFTTSLSLIAAFLVLGVSKFIPTVQFGMLSALVIGLALLADVLLLPAIIYLLRRIF
ncbi:efflux RND transporter permease subunit [Thermodesulfatator autotrophicus]|uniref:SSD domain-containing protein n=1 Tax=Thermodesulfatator autotrophicus TaxID=1795632 RepID=A0A177E7F0_9BACT|nr:efflux RND transporter permease subunit [Thermodesulfatator autotrophicus]OAG27867.1 hypothetical protein TH606_04865 [Thermodesulfatator autotrophicus]